MNHIKEITELIGFEPTPVQRDLWLTDFQLQKNCSIVPASEIEMAVELTPAEQAEINQGIVMKYDGRNKYISGIFYGATDDEKRWNMLESLLRYKWAKIKNGDLIALSPKTIYSS